MRTFRLQVVSHTGLFFEDSVEVVTVPGSEGRFSVLYDHTPLVTFTRDGEIEIQKEGDRLKARISRGLIQVSVEGVLILTERVRWV